MAKKAKGTLAEPKVEIPSILHDAEFAPRPTLSPYASTYMNMFFGATANALKVPNHFLQKCSNLPPYDSLWNNNLRLPNIPQEVGHVLVHHLFTGTFQYLAPQGSTTLEQHTAEFLTCIRTYMIAREYEVSSLAEQARAEIERLGRTMLFPVVLSALVEANPAPNADNAWLSEYLKGRMRIIFNDQRSMKDIMATEVSPRCSVAGMLFHSVLCLRIEESASDYSSNSPGSDGPTEDSAPREISDVPDESFIEVSSFVDEFPVDRCPVDDISAGEADLKSAPDLESPLIITPASSTQSGFATVVGTELGAGLSLVPKKLSKKEKKAMVKEKRRIRAATEINERTKSCERMWEHMTPGNWMSCHNCRDILEGFGSGDIARKQRGDCLLIESTI